MIGFSCILTVYQGTVLLFLKESLFSIFHQTCLPAELIIVFDGFVHSEIENYIDEVIKQNNNIAIKKIKLLQNSGSGIARNTGIKNAKYDWIAIMDCDDYCESTRFEKQIDIILKKPEISFVSTLSSEYCDSFEDQNFLSQKKCPEFSEQIKKRLNYTCCITNPTILFKKDIWEKTGGYGDFRFLHEDHFFFLKLAKEDCNFYCIQESLLKVRIGKKQQKRRFGLKLFLTDIKFRFHCYRKGLINIRGLFILIPLIFRRFMPSFLLPFFHKIWRSI